MILIEQTQVPEAALPVTEFRDHLQLGTGFADDGLQDSVLVAQLRAAIAAIEGDTAKALLKRDFKYVVTAWAGTSRQKLPLAPADEILSLAITDLGGGTELLDPVDYRLVQDTHAPELRWMGWSLPLIPVGGTAEIVFAAGFASEWSAVPADLAQAVLILAAHYYERRSGGTRRDSEMPADVTAICRRHKPIRLLGGGRA